MNKREMGKDFNADAVDPSDAHARLDEEQEHGQVSELAESVTAKARELMPEGDIGNLVDDAGRGLSEATTYVREKVDSVATAVGGALEQTGNYLRDDGFNKITHELTAFVRRNPVPALLCGVAVGFLLAQVVHRRNDEYSHADEINE